MHQNGSAIITSQPPYETDDIFMFGKTLLFDKTTHLNCSFFFREKEFDKNKVDSGLIMVSTQHQVLQYFRNKDINIYLVNSLAINLFKWKKVVIDTCSVGCLFFYFS